VKKHEVGGVCGEVDGNALFILVSGPKEMRSHERPGGTREDIIKKDCKWSMKRGTGFMYL
jgi:hypothetical protein